MPRLLLAFAVLFGITTGGATVATVFDVQPAIGAAGGCISGGRGWKTLARRTDRHHRWSTSRR